MSALRVLCALCVLAGAAAGEEVEPPPSDLLRLDKADQDLAFPLEGGTLRLNFKPGRYLTVVCEGVSLGARTPLPRVEPGTRVAHAHLACPPPPAGYRALLARLGVQVVSRGNLSLALPPAPAAAALSAAHLAGLPPLDRLTLSAASPSAPPAAPRPDLLRAAPQLRALEVRGVPLARDALDAAPASLAALAVGEARVPAAVLARLTSLSARRSELEGEAPLLRTLSLTLNGSAPSWARFPALRTLSLTRWAEARPARWTHCSALESLTLTSARAEALPARWLAACGALRVLVLQSCRAGAPPPALLEGAGGGALEQLSLRYCGLRALPAGLLDPAPRLLHLDLVGNLLHALPGGLFAQTARLQTLVLARNRFEDASVFAEVGALRGLAQLDLSRNERLRDACPGDHLGRFESGESPLRLLRNLSSLQLSYTSVSRVCRDWRESMPRLYRLSLNYTNVTRLSFTDLQHKRESSTWQRSPPPSVELYHAPLRTIEYSAEDEERARSLPPARLALYLSEPLRCDCRMFRCVRALRRHERHLDLRGALLCAAADSRAPPLPLAAVPLDDMLCDSRGAHCPARCACAEQERGAPGAPAWRVRVSCEDAGLSAPPPLPAAHDVEWDLRLARNRIEDLDTLPANLTILDVRNNSVREVSPRAAGVLRGATRAWLAGNPLRCGCALLGAAGALRARGALGEGAACEGRDLAAALQEEGARCAAGGGGAVLGAGLAALGAVLLAAAGAAAALASPARRVRVKAALMAWGWLPRAAEPDDGRPYDAFVSFSEKDEAMARRIVAELEAGARPLRLCLHSRDWTPGEYIGAQIAASVRNARRTLVLVSRNFLASGWARAEFREAAAASARASAPHLVLVFLEPPAALPLDRELRRFLETNTYIEASNPNFWKLLRRAMPPPREPASSAAPEPRPPSAPAAVEPEPTAPPPPPPPPPPPAPATAPSSESLRSESSSSVSESSSRWSRASWESPPRAPSPPPGAPWPALAAPTPA